MSTLAAVSTQKMYTLTITMLVVFVVVVCPLALSAPAVSRLAVHSQVAYVVVVSALAVSLAQWWLAISRLVDDVVVVYPQVAAHK